LSAAKAIAEMNRIEVLESKANDQPDPYLYILKHVKAEMAF